MASSKDLLMDGDTDITVPVDVDELPFEEFLDEDDADPDFDLVVDIEPMDDSGEPQHEESPEEFFDAVKVFMSCMDQNRFVELEPEELHCQLCIDDVTIEEEAKEKIWPSAACLSRHAKSIVHCPKTMIKRKSRQICDNEDGEPLWICPYNSKEKPCNKGSAFADEPTMIRHIEHSTIEKTCAAHGDAKREDRWFEPELE